MSLIYANKNSLLVSHQMLLYPLCFPFGISIMLHTSFMYHVLLFIQSLAFFAALYFILNVFWFIKLSAAFVNLLLRPSVMENLDYQLDELQSHLECASLVMFVKYFLEYVNWCTEPTYHKQQCSSGWEPGLYKKKKVN